MQKQNKIIEERYVLYRLAMVDMERVQRCIGLAESSSDNFIAESLIRDAVVSYIRPFSGNKGVFQKKGLNLPLSSVPSQLRQEHAMVENCRNNLVAHMDLTVQNVKLERYEINGEKHFPFTVTGYERLHLSGLVEPLRKLAPVVNSWLLQKTFDTERNHL